MSTGNELAKTIREAKGEILVPMLVTRNVAHVQAVKKDLLEWAKAYGDVETGMCLHKAAVGIYILVRHF